MALKHKIFLFLGEGKHKIKQMAEQYACKCGIENLKSYSDFTEVCEHVHQKHSILQKTL
jgi:hypothetical protein